MYGGGYLLRQVVLIVIGAMVLATAITFAFGGDDSDSPGLTVDWIDDGGGTRPADARTATATTRPVQTVAPGSPTETGVPQPPAVAGFAYPIAGACPATLSGLLPGAPREYRLATHEGMDFYEFNNCTEIDLGTLVIAAKAGVVRRADVAYEALTEVSLAEIEALAIASGGGSEAAVDGFRGRQVWIEHQDGTVTRYAHLSGIAAGIEEGGIVAQGELIGFVGESGTPESVREPGTQYHLHFEIRMGTGFLGQGLSPEAAGQLYAVAFTETGD